MNALLRLRMQSMGNVVDSAPPCSLALSLSISLFLVLIQRLRVATTDAYANELLVHVHASENPNIRKKPALNGKMMIASVELL